MKRFSLFHLPVLSFFSGALYWDVARNWKGVCFGYLLLLLLFCWIPGMVKVHRGFSDFLENEAPKIIEQIPEIRILQGEASTPENRPYPIVEPETGETVFLIDTTGATTTLEEAGPTVKGLVTKTGAIIEKSEIETRSFDFSTIEDFTLTGEKIEGWADLVRKLLVPVMLPFAWLGSFVYRMFQALFYSLFGLAIAAMLGASGNLPYAALLRVTVVAMGPGILLKTLLGLIGFAFPFAWLLFFLLSMFYLFFGLRSATRESTEPGPPPMPGAVG